MLLLSGHDAATSHRTAHTRRRRYPEIGSVAPPGCAELLAQPGTVSRGRATDWNGRVSIISHHPPTLPPRSPRPRRLSLLFSLFSFLILGCRLPPRSLNSPALVSSVSPRVQCRRSITPCPRPAGTYMPACSLPSPSHLLTHRSSSSTAIARSFLPALSLSSPNDVSAPCRLATHRSTTPALTHAYLFHRPTNQISSLRSPPAPLPHRRAQLQLPLPRIPDEARRQEWD